MPAEPPTPPPLPPALADPRPVMAAGTVGWVVALVVLLSGGAASTSTAIVTCGLGASLGALGYGLFFWQRRAVRRGDRGSQRGIG